MATEVRSTDTQGTPVSSEYQALLDYGRGNGYKLDWLQPGPTLGTSPEFNSKAGGLLLQDADLGPFGQVPEFSDNMSGRPRGAIQRPSAPRVGNYPVRTKADVWLRNGAQLYEEAVQRQWSSSTDVPWHTLEELPDDIERAECMLATFLTEVEFVAGDVPGKWIAYTTPDYYEPRMFLISQIMDEARHMDVFRKRALANGGGLMGQLDNSALAGGAIDSARDFTEMSARLHISGEGLVLSIFRMGELMSYNDAEKAMYRLAASDESRHVAFGVMHLQYLSQTDPERKAEIHSYLDEIEIGLARGFGGQNPAARGTPSSAALSILLGGGADAASLREGEQIAVALRQRQIKEYVQRVRVAGFGDRFEDGRANPALAQYVAA
ncbi:MAG: ferritin-like domain-containing protein [Chloroflexi bacterium]|nr:ferritin-like domain-containing protein [Chloroflexota bacterium]MDA1145783.1 ferritin-like domain-containing protein [Chloroflexota bacterium]